MKTTYYGTKANEYGEQVCAVCGTSNALGIIFTDGPNFVSQTYQCVQCGSQFVMKIEFEPGDIDYQEGE